jgi:hypothetical protein
MNAPDSGPTNLFSSPFFSAQETPENPKPPQPQWRGVMIAGPAQAKISLKEPMIIVHGTYRISGANYPANDRIKFVAINVATKREFTGYAGQRDASPDAPRPPSEKADPSVLKRMVFSGFFNADLVATVKLPWTTASYRVRAEFGAIPSNEITVQVLSQ